METIVRDYVNKHVFLNYVKGITGEKFKTLIGSKVEARLAGMYPDGGMWFDDDGKLVLAIECKYQGIKGNAIERWNKNANMARALGVKRYLTFCGGEGFFYPGTSEAIISSSYLALNPKTEKIWGNEEDVWGFYRFRTIDEARVNIPLILEGELLRLGFLTER